MEKDKRFSAAMGLMIGLAVALFFCFFIGILSLKIPTGMFAVAVRVAAVVVAAAGVVAAGTGVAAGVGAVAVVTAGVIVAVIVAAGAVPASVLAGAVIIIVVTGGLITGLITEAAGKEKLCREVFYTVITITFLVISTVGSYFILSKVNLYHIKIDRKILKEVSVKANSNSSLVFTFNSKRQKYIRNFYQVQVNEEIFHFSSEITNYNLFSKTEVIVIRNTEKVEKEKTETHCLTITLPIPEEMPLPEKVTLSTKHFYLNVNKVLEVK